MPTSMGVAYHPESTGRFNPHTLQDLKQAGVKYVRITWLDFSSITRIRILPIAFFEKLLASIRPGIVLPKTALTVVGDGVAEGISEAGDHVFAFDLQSLRLAPYATGHAAVFGWFQKQRPNPTTNSLIINWCPRTALNRLVKEAEELETTFLIGVETEFTLVKQTENAEAINNTSGSSASSMTYTGSAASSILDEIGDTLLGGGIKLEVMHAEAGVGQFVIITAPLRPLEAADAIVFTHETIYNIANKNGLRATLTPQLPGEKYGSASHCHVSIQSTATGPTSPIAPTLKGYEASFLQSLLTNLSSICAFALPLAASYERIRGGISSGGTWVCWGTANKETPIRLCGTEGAYDFEIKCIDGTGNPYLVFASIIAAGLDAVKNKMELRIGDFLGAATDLGHEGREERNVVDKMPLGITEARKRLEDNAVMREYLGQDLVDKYISLNTLLNRQLSSETLEGQLENTFRVY